MSKKRIITLAEVVIILFLSLSLASVFSVKTVNAQTDGQVTLKPTDDTYVDSSSPDSNYGGQTLFGVENSEYYSTYYNSTTQDTAWLKFDLSTIPNGVTVDNATLQLFALIIPETSNVNAYSCADNSWTELTLTYSNMPSYNTSPIDSVVIASGYQWYSWSVIDAVRNELNNNSKAVTIVLNDSPQNSINFNEFMSKEGAADTSPKLTISWSKTVPELPIFMILPLFLIATMLVILAFKKSHAW